MKNTALGLVLALLVQVELRMCCMAGMVASRVPPCQSSQQPEYSYAVDRRESRTCRALECILYSDPKFPTLSQKVPAILLDSIQRGGKGAEVNNDQPSLHCQKVAI